MLWPVRYPYTPTRYRRDIGVYGYITTIGYTTTYHPYLYYPMEYYTGMDTMVGMFPWSTEDVDIDRIW